jgi:hypothetical protein
VVRCSHEPQRKAGDQDTAENEPLDQVEHDLDLREVDDSPIFAERTPNRKTGSVF